MRNLLIILFVAVLPLKSLAQCCGAGNPLSSADSEHHVGSGNLQLSVDYRYSESDKYYEGSHESDFDFPGRISSSGYHFLLLGANYGITDRLAMRVRMGYYFNKYEDYSDELFPDVSSKGLGDMSVGLSYVVYRHLIEGISVSPFVMFKLPVGKFDNEKDRVKLPISMQPSSGSYKYTLGLSASWSVSPRWYLTTTNYVEYSQRIKSYRFNYKYGPLLYLSMSGFFRPVKQVEVGGLLSYENRGRAEEYGVALRGTKYQQLKLAPAVAVYADAHTKVACQVEWPLWRNVESIQMANKWAVALKLMYNLKISGK